MYYLQVAMIVTSIVLPLLAIAAVAGRFSARNSKNLAIGADDWTILVASVCCAGPPQRTLCISPV